MRLKFKIESYMSSTSAGEKDIGSAEWGYEICDAFNDGNTRKYTIEDGVTAQAVDLAGVGDVRFLALRTDQNITLLINGTESLNIYVPTGFEFGYYVATLSGITSLAITNQSGERAVVSAHMAGDI